MWTVRRKWDCVWVNKFLHWRIVTDDGKFGTCKTHLNVGKGTGIVRYHLLTLQNTAEMNMNTGTVWMVLTKVMNM
jgi:hypothetical protein